MTQYRLVALPGEGIGSEVVNAALEILRRVAQLQGFSLQIDYELENQLVKNSETPFQKQQRNYARELTVLYSEPYLKEGCWSYGNASTSL